MHPFVTMAPSPTGNGRDFDFSSIESLLEAHHQTEINRIEKVQRNAVRWCNQSHVGEMLEGLQWPEHQNGGSRPL